MLQIKLKQGGSVRFDENSLKNSSKNDSFNWDQMETS